LAFCLFGNCLPDDVEVFGEPPPGKFFINFVSRAAHDLANGGSQVCAELFEDAS